MCITAVIAGAALLASAVGTYATIQSNNAQANYAKWEATERTKELKENNELARISAMQKENERAREFNRTWSASLAAIGASGLGEHLSFFQGIAPENMAAFNDDIRAIRLGLASNTQQNQRQIRVIGYGSRVASYNRSMGNLGALAGFMGDAMEAFSFYNTNKTPKGP